MPTGPMRIGPSAPTFGLSCSGVPSFGKQLRATKKTWSCYWFAGRCRFLASGHLGALRDLDTQIAKTGLKLWRDEGHSNTSFQCSAMEAVIGRPSADQHDALCSVGRRSLGSVAPLTPGQTFSLQPFDTRFCTLASHTRPTSANNRPLWPRFWSNPAKFGRIYPGRRASFPIVLGRAGCAQYSDTFESLPGGHCFAESILTAIARVSDRAYMMSTLWDVWRGLELRPILRCSSCFAFGRRWFLLSLFLRALRDLDPQIANAGPNDVCS